jgi:hypothetical protein
MELHCRRGAAYDLCRDREVVDAGADCIGAGDWTREDSVAASASICAAVASRTSGIDGVDNRA